jgi:hypothetical protein
MIFKGGQIIFGFFHDRIDFEATGEAISNLKLMVWKLFPIESTSKKRIHQARSIMAA